MPERQYTNCLDYAIGTDPEIILQQKTRIKNNMNEVKEHSCIAANWPSMSVGLYYMHKAENADKPCTKFIDAMFKYPDRDKNYTSYKVMDLEGEPEAREGKIFLQSIFMGIYNYVGEQSEDKNADNVHYFRKKNGEYKGVESVIYRDPTEVVVNGEQFEQTTENGVGDKPRKNGKTIARFDVYTSDIQI